MRLFHGFMPGGSGLDAAPGYLYGKSNQRAGKISAQEVSRYPKGTSDGGSSPGSDSAAWKLSDGGSRNLSGRSGASRAGIFAGNAVVLAGACGEGTVYREHAGEKKLEEQDLPGARSAVARIVGRDTQNLDAAGVAKAAIETVAENFSDGVAAPLFYLVIGGAPLGLCYKAINTMDSMVGYKNDRYLYFGRAAAKLDDVANYIPARISAFLMMFAACLSGQNAKHAFQIWKRDRYNHASPNSAQTESVAAGALDILLAGDAWYFGKLVKKPTIGENLRTVEAADIMRINRMMIVASLIALVLFLAVRCVLCILL